VEAKPHKKKFSGIVVSDKMDKTVVVAVESKIKHPIYTKYIKNTKKFKAHDEENKCRLGDFVEIIECRPLSRDKRWRVVSILKQATETLANTEEQG
jgi:small subunit ribosomal protein S17